MELQNKEIIIYRDEEKEIVCVKLFHKKSEHVTADVRPSSFTNGIHLIIFSNSTLVENSKYLKDSVIDGVDLGIISTQKIVVECLVYEMENGYNQIWFKKKDFV